MVVVVPVVAGAIKAATALIGVGKVAILPFLIAAFAYYHYDQFDPENRPLSVNQVDAEYDFVIVGGGAGGAVVANRLSEIEGWKVLLLEAGGHETEITDVPILSLYLHKSRIDWGYRTQPQDSACQAMRDKRCSWTRGKVLGGSTVLNTMLYVRGNRRDYDQWASFGNAGWSYEEVLPYFLKSQDQRNPYLAKNKYHATGGLLTVQNSPYNTPLGIAFLQAGQEMGYEIRDINGERQTGFALFQYNMRRGSRCSTAKAFLRPIRLRKNFHLSLWSHVTKVLVDPATKQTQGVEFIRNNQRHVVRARKEVILSAGAINTPQLLMLSGIGPAAHLREKGVAVVHDSPGVGQNVQDHIAVGGITFLIDESIALLTTRLVTANTALRYAVKEDGPLTSSVGIETAGFVNTKYANASDDWPDMEFMLLSTSTAADGGTQVKHAHGLADDFYQEVFASIDYRDQFGIFPMMLRPRARGVIKLKSKDPLDYPLMYHNYLTNYHDVAVLREGVKAAIALGETYALRRFGARLHRKLVPNCKHLPAFTDDYWDCFVRQYTLSIYHYSCSAKMGPPSDPMAVVDPKLRVYGVAGLRVIDASVMPTITNGNINAPTIMIGEKGADMIKEHWLKRGARRKRRVVKRSLARNATRPDAEARS